MLSLFNKFQKKEELSSQSEAAQAAAIERIEAPISHEVSEESLKKSIASKLQRYQPLQKESNFTGPSYRR